MNAQLSSNRSMPSSTVIPVLGYPDAGVAAEWLCRAFGFFERLRIGDHRVQLDVGDGNLVVTQMGGVPMGRCGHAIMVRVADATAHEARATKAGARIVHGPADYPYGERQYSAEDFAGHQWTFSQSIADVDPATWGGTLLSASRPIHRLPITVLPPRFAICRLAPDDAIPQWTSAAREFLAISRTRTELSIVADEDAVPSNAAATRGFRALRVEGPLPFEMVGVAAAIAGPLAAAGISIIPIGTYDTDYILVRDVDLSLAVATLTAAGHRVRNE